MDDGMDLVPFRILFTSKMTTAATATTTAPAAVVKASKTAGTTGKKAAAAAAAPAPSAAPKAKRAVTRFIAFSQKHREEVKAANPDAKFTDIAKLLAAKWNALTDKQKEQYGTAPKTAE